MESIRAPRPRYLPPLFFAGILVSFVFALGLFYLLMQPSLGDLRAMAVFLSLTAMASLLAGYTAYRLGWIYRSPHLGWTLLGGYGLAGVLAFVNVWVTARLMFASSHDLQLATVLLLFAGGIALSLGLFFSMALTDRIRELDRAASDVARGKFDARVLVHGSDEMASLAHTFNSMAAQLQSMSDRQRELDTLRRDLVAWAGHDLRTPLASLRVTVEALADRIVTDPATVARYLDSAAHDIQSLSHLVDDLFELAQLDAGGLALERRANSLSDLISDTVESFSAQAERSHIRLLASCSPEVDPVWMDAPLIGRVLANLVHNALRHTPENGMVEITARAGTEGVRVQVEDSGEGIEAADLPRVFDQFYRGEKSRSRKTGGAGLGLAIARGIVEAHGGRIYAESERGRGSRFVIILPRDKGREITGR